uniref:Uncharacterized protein n=1 Tax=Ciona savignyi TaxID=51511 RepID=H2Z4W9_CIOSA
LKVSHIILTLYPTIHGIGCCAFVRSRNNTVFVWKNRLSLPGYDLRFVVVVRYVNVVVIVFSDLSRHPETAVFIAATPGHGARWRIC